MRTRSQTRNRPQQQVPPNIEPFNLEEPIENQAPPVVTMADQRTMAQLLQAPTEGYEDAIVVPAITADNFELKHGLLTLVQNKQFFGLDKEDPHAHIRYFNKITSTLKFPNVPNTSIKLMLFPFSLEGAARIWLEKEPPRSIFTWDDLVSKFINQFFPPSKTTNLRNEITSFRQRFDESFSEAWDRFKDLLRACPHHGFSELHQLDTFYNSLNSNDQDSLNSAAGGSGSLPSNTVANPRGDMKAITTRSGVSYDGPQVPPPPSSPPKVVEHEPEVTKDTVHPSTENIQPLEEKLHEKDDLLTLKFVEMFRNLHFELSFADALLHMTKFAPMFRKLLNNKDKIIDLIKTPVNENCSAVILKKFPKNLETPVDFSHRVIFQIGTFLFLAEFIVVDYIADPRVSLILERPFLRTARALIDVHGEQMTLRHDDQSITFNVGDTKTFSYNTIESSGNPTPTLEPILSTSPTSLTPFEGGDFILEEIEACLTSESIPPGIDDADFEIKEDLLTLERLLNSDPTSTLPLHFEEIKTIKSSIDDPPELELKDLPSHLEYAFLKGTDKLPVIISKELKDEEKAALLKVLKSHKRAIAWKISDIKGIDPSFCTHKILMEDDFKPAVQHQRRVNPKIHEVIKKEVIKLLDAGLIYPISDSPWVSPVHCVPKKGGMTVVENEDNELIPTRLVTGWRVCIDYRKLNDATRKDHFPLPFMDQMLERLAGNEYYCFLDGFFGYFQIPIDPQDQEKTTFTCPYGMFAYRRMPFGLCNAPGTFQRCMMAIFHDMIEETMEVFMDDFSVFGDSFSSCLSHLDKMLKRCEDTNLVLNWEKCHFMVKEGIVLGHKISKSGIEVDKAKVDVIAKLPHPTSV
ncbi:reverse transcriptase domain-containing protein [Tanacetum coccineum]